MLDVNMPARVVVRQVLYGKGYFRQRLGVEVTVAGNWTHLGSCPDAAVVELGGYKSFWFFRAWPR